MPEATAVPSVVVVDDNAMFRDIAKEWLSHSFNDRVAVFQDGRSAWNHLKASATVDIVVSDVTMPGMNGFDLISRVKRRYPRRICILISGNPENEAFAKSSGADVFMAKPFSMRDLVTTMHSLYSNGADRAA